MRGSERIRERELLEGQKRDREAGDKDRLREERIMGETEEKEGKIESVLVKRENVGKQKSKGEGRG